MRNRAFIESILSSDDLNGSIIELDNQICEQCSWGDDLDALTEPEKNFYYNQEFEREINNGGFSQYFFNTAGGYANNTIISLQLIGANKTASILQAAINQFPDNKIPLDHVDRQNAIELIADEAYKAWEELDQKFFLYEDDLNALNINYVKQNISAFT